METIKRILEDLGFHIAFALAGVFGSYVSMSQKGELKFWQRFSVMIAGAATANYLTPLICDYFNIGEQTRYGFAFLLGFIGVEGVQIIILRLKKMINNKSGKPE